MAGEPGDGDPAEPSGRAPRGARVGPVDARRQQQGLAGRLFPGPSNRISRRQADHIQALLRFPDDPTRPRPRRDRLDQLDRPATGDDPPSARTPPVAAAGGAASAETARVQEALAEQSEILRAILSTTVDSQTDARSTAQNSRTFAWAATVIALLTFVATVVSIIAAVHGS